MCLVFYDYLGAAEKNNNNNKTKQNKKASEVFLSISLEWLKNALFGKEIAVGLGLVKCLSVSVLWNLGTTARPNRAHCFHFLIAKCVLKCGVDHTWRRTSASVNLGCFRDHQVKLK